MRVSDIDEILVDLYLRLNGYFTTGFIAHSPTWGQAKAEIDCLAIRHPHYCEPERLVEPSDFLGRIENEVDLLLCEVKHDPSMVGFNPALKDRNALTSVLRRAGVIPPGCIATVVEGLLPLLEPDVELREAKAGIVESGVRIRALACSPPASKLDSQKWYLAGGEIFEYLHLCFSPANPRDSCSTRYNFKQWGPLFHPIVTYIKGANAKDATELSINDLYQAFGCA